MLRMTPYEHLVYFTMHSRHVNIVSYGVVVEKSVSRNQSGVDLQWHIQLRASEFR